MAADHYVPKFLTKPWEHGDDRQFRCFDFCTREFSDPYAKRLLAQEGLNSPEVEKWLNQTMEDPVGKYVHRLRTDPDADLGPSEKEARGLAYLVLFNAQRIGEARGEVFDRWSLEQLSTEPEALDAAVAYLSSYRQMCVRVLPDDYELFFTEVAMFGIPYAGLPVLALPLGLQHVLLVYDGPDPIREVVAAFPDPFIMACSLGVGSDVHRVILPPEWRVRSCEDEDDARRRLLALRESMRELVDTVGRASLRIGLPAWGVA